MSLQAHTTAERRQLQSELVAAAASFVRAESQYFIQFDRMVTSVVQLRGRDRQVVDQALAEQLLAKVKWATHGLEKKKTWRSGTRITWIGRDTFGGAEYSAPTIGCDATADLQAIAHKFDCDNPGTSAAAVVHAVHSNRPAAQSTDLFFQTLLDSDIAALTSEQGNGAEVSSGLQTLSGKSKFEFEAETIPSLKIQGNIDGRRRIRLSAADRLVHMHNVGAITLDGYDELVGQQPRAAALQPDRSPACQISGPVSQPRHTPRETLPGLAATPAPGFLDAMEHTLSDIRFEHRTFELKIWVPHDMQQKTLLHTALAVLQPFLAANADICKSAADKLRSLQDTLFTWADKASTFKNDVRRLRSNDDGELVIKGKKDDPGRKHHVVV